MAEESSVPIITTATTADGRTIQVRPCKYYPNCAKMDDAEHNTMYSHNAVVKRPPRTINKDSPRLGAGAGNVNMQLCGFGEHCKRCGDEDHLDRYIHSCKFGNRCKKIEDPIHLKRFIHVLPGAFPSPAPPVPSRGGSRHGGFGPYSAPSYMPSYPPYAYPYPPPLPTSYAGYPTGSGYSPPHASSHHSRSGAGYHPYASAGAGSAAGFGGRPSDVSNGFDPRGTADRAAAAAYGAYNAYPGYGDSSHLLGPTSDLTQYAL